VGNAIVYILETTVIYVVIDTSDRKLRRKEGGRQKEMKREQGRKKDTKNERRKNDRTVNPSLLAPSTIFSTLKLIN
jgi:hypothetical protein